MFPFGTLPVCFILLLPKPVTSSLAIGIDLSRRDNSVIPSLATCSQIGPAPSVLSDSIRLMTYSQSCSFSRLYLTRLIFLVFFSPRKAWSSLSFSGDPPPLPKQVVPAHRMADIALHDGVVFDADYYWFYWLCTFLGKERWVFFFCLLLSSRVDVLLPSPIL